MRTFRVWFTLGLLGSATVLPADVLTRVTEIGPGDEDGLTGLAAAVLGGQLYFVARPPVGGNALFRYDGSSTPVLVPGSEVADPGWESLVAWNGKLYFSGGPSGDQELWVYDPANGSFAEAVDVRPTGNGNPEGITLRGDRICFAAFGEAIGRELACWDGSGPADLYDLAPGADSSFPDWLAADGDRLVFAAQQGGVDRLWVLAGSAAPAVVEPGVPEPFDGPCCALVRGQETFFQAADSGSSYRLWRHDGVAPPAPVSSTFEVGGLEGLFRGRVVVGGADPDAGVETEELWRLGPSGLRRLGPGLEVAQSDAVTVLREALFLRGYVGGASDYALYRFCGAGRAARLTDPGSGTDPSITGDRMVAFGGRLYFSATDAASGGELWRFDSSHLFCDDFESGDAAFWSSTQP